MQCPIIFDFLNHKKRGRIDGEEAQNNERKKWKPKYTQKHRNSQNKKWV